MDLPELPPALMLVGRLDGRLQNIPAREIWRARARIGDAATIAEIAGVSVYADDILNCNCGRTPPPRRSKGLNDPMSIAAAAWEDPHLGRRPPADC